MSKNFTLIKESTIEKIASENPLQIYDAVAEAYVQHFHHKAINPPSHFLTFPDRPSSRIIALPAAIMENPRMSGIKWISSNPDNIKNSLKRASAVIILNDYETGFPIACMEGAVISALRTVNSAILAASLVLPNKNIKRLGIIGCGNISKNFLECLGLQGFIVDEINVFDQEMSYAKKFSNQIPSRIYENIEELIKNSSLILLATTAAKPYIHKPSWLAHNPIVLNISLRDLAPEILINSNNIVDDVEHVLKANTAPHLTQMQYGNSDFINATIGEMIVKKIKLPPNKPTIISPMGMGILDIAVAEYIYRQAKKMNLAIEINDFFN